MKKKTAPVKTSVNWGTCEIFASYPMRCPLCQVQIPANTHHTCETPKGPHYSARTPGRDPRD